MFFRTITARILYSRFMIMRKSVRACWRALQNIQGLSRKIFDGERHELIRYDSGHDCPRKDILDHRGGIVRKVWYDFLDNNQALTMAMADIKGNYEFYKERYYKWLKG